MKKLTLALSILLGLQAFNLQAQKYFTRNGNVSFHSRALLEDIDAYNQQGTFVLDVSTKKIQMAVLIKAFQFEKALMQEHFNENYMESDQYPKAVFAGMVVSPENIDLTKPGKYTVGIEGQLTIRGTEKSLKTTAEWEVKPGSIRATCQFPVAVEDFRISIPSVVKDKIAREVEVRIDVNLEQLP